MISFAKPLILYTASACADVGSTEYALARNPSAREWNLYLQTREARIARGAIGVALATLLDVELQKRAPKWVFVPRIVIPVASAVIAVHNIKQGRK